LSRRLLIICDMVMPKTVGYLVPSNTLLLVILHEDVA